METATGTGQKCRAKSKRSGVKCKNWAMRGKDLCHIHGGKSLSGSSLPQFKHGRYSKSLPEKLAARYEEAQKDPELLSLRDDVALIDARLSELLGKANTGESAEAWGRVRKAMVSLQKAEAGGNPERVREARFALEDAVERGGADIEIWAEIGDHLERRRKLTESERKRLVQMEQMIRADQAMSFVAALVSSVKRHVEEPKTLAAISDDIRSIVSRDISGSGPGTITVSGN